MAETQLLRTSAIVRTATVAPPQHGPVKTGALPLVQVRMVPGGPQIQEGQQKAVTILPPRDAKSAVQTGGLPMVNVKMTQNGPQANDGRDNPVLIKNAKNGAVSAGGLPMVQVKMDGGRPQVQNLPNVQSAPPQIQSAPPVLSPQRTRIVAPRQAVHAPVRAQPVQVQPTMTQVPELSTDQLMLCRHLVDKYLGDLRAISEADDDNAKIAEDTIFVIDQVLAAATAQAAIEPAGEAGEVGEVSVPAGTIAVGTPAAVRTVGYVTPAAFAPLARSGPVRSGYVAQRPGTRFQVRGGQNNGSMAPRRGAARPVGAAPLPPVIVNMNGQKPVVQTQAAADQLAAEHLVAQAQASVEQAAQVAAPQVPVEQAAQVAAETVQAPIVISPPSDGDAQD